MFFSLSIVSDQFGWNPAGYSSQILHGSVASYSIYPLKSLAEQYIWSLIGEDMNVDELSHWLECFFTVEKLNIKEEKEN